MPIVSATGLRVAVCTGKSCRRRDEHVALRDELAATDAEVVEVSCLGICNGPVVVVQPASDDAVVLKRMRAKKARRKLCKLSQWPAKLPGRLRDQMVSGGKRNKALHRARRAIERRSRRER